MTPIDLSPGIASWVTGVRPKLPEGNWVRLTVNLIQLRFDRMGKHGDTSEAEKALGLPKSAYWFVLRPERAFGRTVFLFRPALDGLDEDERGLLPFDSGGLVAGYIRTLPDLTDRESMRAFVDAEVHPLAHWPMVFTKYVEANYNALISYVKGDPPSTGTPPIVNKSPPNESRAWDWEVHINLDRAAERTELLLVFMKTEDLDYLYESIHDSSAFSENDRDQLFKWLSDEGKCRVPDGEEPWEAAQELLGMAV